MTQLPSEQAVELQNYPMVDRADVYKDGQRASRRGR